MVEVKNFVIAALLYIATLVAISIIAFPANAEIFIENEVDSGYTVITFTGNDIDCEDADLYNASWKEFAIAKGFPYLMEFLGPKQEPEGRVFASSVLLTDTEGTDFETILGDAIMAVYDIQTNEVCIGQVFIYMGTEA